MDNMTPLSSIKDQNLKNIIPREIHCSPKLPKICFKAWKALHLYGPHIFCRSKLLLQSGP